MGCLSDLSDFCLVVNLPREQFEYVEILRELCFHNEKDEIHKKVYSNRKYNTEFYVKIIEENEKVKGKMKQIIKELKKEGASKNPRIIIGTGNSCNNDCYLYNLDLVRTCPKCEGKVEQEVENDYIIEKKWKDGVLKEYKYYNEKKICTGFRWNENIDQIDVNLNAMFEYFDKKDPQSKTHWSFVVEDPNTHQRNKEEYDVENHYMMINGERFDFPYGLTMREFFRLNNLYFFPMKLASDCYLPDDIPIEHNTIFWYENIREEIGQPLGYYLFGETHIVYIYTCNSCGYKYHIIKTSPFAFRDKSKDPK